MDDLLFKVAKRRMREIAQEIPHPEVTTHFSVDKEGRGLIDIFLHGDPIGHEIIETSKSWQDKEERLFAYRKVLNKKIRLVVMAPRQDVMMVRMMMLELNHWWLFNYMIYGYDNNGRLVRVLRPSPPVTSVPCSV
jgi:hypothetical protein